MVGSPMKTERVGFRSDGEIVEAWLRLPSSIASPFPAVIQGPGWLGLATTKSYEPYHQAFAAAGYAMLVFNYRGFGGSGGTTKRIDPSEQVRDWTNAIAFARSHEAVDEKRIGLFGSGATGSG